MHEVKQMFADFFRRKYEAYSEIQQPIHRSQPRGWLEEFRAEAFQTAYYPTLKTGALWSRLSGEVYEIAHFQLSVVLALYGDGTILWLDDHSSELDFEEFIRREHLMTWLPDQMDDLLDLLIETKFKFFGQPRLIHNVSEVPRLTEREKSLQATSKEGMEAFLEEEKLLDSIAAQIQPPVCAPDRSGAFQLSFCMWTRILGKVIITHCSFESDESFSYEAIQLAEQVGRFLVPR
jgi:hypothetical protein